MTAIPRAFLTTDEAVEWRLPAREWHALTLELQLSIGPTPLRLFRFGDRWLASANSLDGPTLGCNGSPYLAAAAALEPFGVGLPEAMSLVGRHADSLR